MKDDYIKAWTEEDGGEKTDPVVSAVKAARKMDDEEYATAFKTDKFDKEPEGDATKSGDDKKAGE